MKCIKIVLKTQDLEVASFNPIIILSPNCVTYQCFDKLKLLQVVPSGHQVFAWNAFKIIWMSRFKGIKFLVINCVFGFFIANE